VCNSDEKIEKEYREFFILKNSLYLFDEATQSFGKMH
jgi:hypothetical protein